jgi:hypothetical protein
MAKGKIIVEHAAGGETELDHVSSVQNRAFFEQEIAEIYVKRREINEGDFEERKDEVYLYIDDVVRFGGILRDLTRDGSLVEMLVDSFETLARDAKPTGPNKEFTDVTDKSIIESAVDSTPGLTKGDIQTLKSSMQATFNRSHPAKQIRTIQEIVGGEVQYNPDKSVDYSESRGSDNTDITISPREQNGFDWRIETSSWEGDVTHLLVLGSGEGEAQKSVEVVTSDYEEGDKQVWKTYVNKEIDDTDMLQTLGERLIDEFGEKFVTVEVTVKDVTVNIGDTFRIWYPEENVEDELRAVSVEEILDKDGYRFECEFSKSIETAKGSMQSEREAIQRYNSQAVANTPPLEKHDELSDAIATFGMMVGITGDGSDTQGVYWYNGTDWAQL